MPIVKITGQGLSAIGLSVALLWGCWAKQQAVVRQDRMERARVLRDLREMRQHTTPVSAPMRPPSRRVTAG